MTEKILLEIIVTQLGVVILLFSFLWRSHEKKHDTIDLEIKGLNDQRKSCSKSFASKESVGRAHERLDEHDDDIAELKTSVTKLEVSGRNQ